jgi:hypothetical protein
MTTMRRIGQFAAIPIAVIALSGAATNPTVTYHGVFDDTAQLSSTCPPMFETEGWSGVWNLQLKNTEIGTPVMVQMNLKFNGTPHAVLRVPFETVAPTASLTLHGVQDPAPWDHGEVTLAKNGTFTYIRDLNIPDVLVCRATFTGHLTN